GPWVCGPLIYPRLAPRILKGAPGRIRVLQPRLVGQTVAGSGVGEGPGHWRSGCQLGKTSKPDMSTLGEYSRMQRSNPALVTQKLLARHLGPSLISNIHCRGS